MTLKTISTGPISPFVVCDFTHCKADKRTGQQQRRFSRFWNCLQYLTTAGTSSFIPRVFVFLTLWTDFLHFSAPLKNDVLRKGEAVLF